MRFTAIIIDDERNSRDSLQKKILQYCKTLKLLVFAKMVRKDWRRSNAIRAIRFNALDYWYNQSRPKT